ncbi:MAG: PASTA domain-containing protein [Armatimonadetes bacterium]|nr:PASTA domain-containing protein [Armatimonadota bacterium]
MRIRYELLQEIGESPVFLSFVAHDRVTERNVVVRAVREPFTSEPKFISKLRAAVEKSKRADSPAVSLALDFDEHEGQWFIVYQYAPGQSLAERMKRASAFTVPKAVSTAIGVLEGLDAVHRAGLVHGDVCPHNVVVSQAGKTTLLMPCVWEAFSASDTAGAEMLPLMAPYLAPDVSAGQMPSPSSDVYAMGVLLYEMLTGKRPFTASTAVGIATAHAERPFPPVRQKIAAAPEALEQILAKATAKESDDRYGGAAEMLADLRMLQDAMRFGRPLTWPLKSGQDVPTEQRVGPKLNVVRGEEKEQKVARRRARARADGTPAWLVYICLFMTIGAIGAVGSWMYFNFQAPQTLKVPKIVGMGYNEASDVVEGMNLKLRSVRQEPSEEIAQGKIISVAPAVGRDVKEHSFIDAVVSSGSQFVEVPDLTGKTVSMARSMLASMNLVLSSQNDSVRSRDVPKGQIISQNPEVDAQVDRGSTVKVQVSNGNVRFVPEPLPAETFVYHVSWQLPDWSTAILVRVEMQDDERTRTIHERMHQPNETVSIDAEGVGLEATFSIYYDDQLQRRVTQRAVPDDDRDDGDDGEDGEDLEDGDE